MRTAISELNLEDPAATEDFASKLGSRLRGGEVIELIGDVGAGKTTFVRGLARGMGSKDKVSSPTFTVSQEYDAGRLTLYHYDFYRISDYEIIKRELAEVAGNKDSVVVMEWAEELAGSENAGLIKVRIFVTGELSRRVQISMPEKHSYLEDN
jgi:tRNA threonylcarbamoyladenosine biosynthesis protein TsaE